MTPKRALVREPGRRFTSCLSCHPLRNTVDLRKAREQHSLYRRTLRDLGLEVIELPRDDSRPDACFVEDNAVVRGRKALICRMGAESRRGEEKEIEAALVSLGMRTRRASPPATIEGGDVVHLEDRLISGISRRTNAEGVSQMADWLETKVDTLRDPKMMHLKSHVSYLGRGIALVDARYADSKCLEGLNKIIVPQGEEYAADNLAVGDRVVLPKGMPRTSSLLRKAGFVPISLDLSEFEKCDGAVTCLSILV